MLLFSEDSCADARGQTSYDEFNRPFIYGGQCDFACGFCASPCGPLTYIANLAKLDVSLQLGGSWIFGCTPCVLGSTDLDDDTFTRCTWCLPGQFAPRPGICTTCEPGVGSSTFQSGRRPSFWFCNWRGSQEPSTTILTR
jgi:hypothetical protein